ncbi:MAG: AAA family ATPase, partial [Kiritimatiellae bacterium]|nr:AAA family ATPase [Kiritimatiellia bacterium]
FSERGLDRLVRFALKRETNLFSLLLQCEQERLLADFSCSLTMTNGATISVDDLSEGEKQLAIVMGMLQFSQHEESLFLLDEPDTHLNPAWSVKYIETLEKVYAPKNDHILLATHDPLVVSGLRKSQVRIMQREPETGQIVISEPDEDLIGMGVSALLKSDIYGLRSDLDTATLDKLDRRAQLYAKGDQHSEQEQLELIQLSNELATLGFVHEFRDPTYKLFAEAMARRVTVPPTRVLSADELSTVEGIADSILDEMGVGDGE